MLEGVKRAARDWAANNRSAAWLIHTSRRLADANRLREERPDLSSNLAPTERDYLAACRESELTAHRKTRRMQAFFALLVLLLVTAGAGWWEQDVLRAEYQWRFVMRPSVLTAEDEQTKAAAPGAIFSECKKGCPDMVVVPAGKFMRGSRDSEKDRLSDEGPQHEVTIAKPFAVSKFEVTFDQWDACTAATATCVKAKSDVRRGRQPVIQLSWEDAQQYVKWLSDRTGKEYRLLSEAEWEYAARGGKATGFSFGDEESQLGDFAWVPAKNSEGKAHPVGGKQPNDYGLHDMHGNVWEWVEDCYEDNYECAEGWLCEAPSSLVKAKSVFFAAVLGLRSQLSPFGETE